VIAISRRSAVSGPEMAVIGPAGVEGGHGGDQPVAEPAQMPRVLGRPLAVALAYRDLERSQFGLPQALGKDHLRRPPGQAPELAPARILMGDDGRKGILERARHPLRGAIVAAERLDDVLKVDSHVPRGRHLSQTQEIHRLGEGQFNLHDSLCRNHAIASA